jgi:hypothetical protein
VTVAGWGEDSSGSEKHRNLIFAKSHFSWFSVVGNTNLWDTELDRVGEGGGRSMTRRGQKNIEI